MIQRNTHQRDSIRDFLQAAARPLSPAEILSGAQRKIPRLGMATVYRTVKELVESQWLRPVELPGEPARYELAGQAHHHHFHCRQCNRVYDVAGCPGNLRPLLPSGFELQDHEVVLYGKCERCALSPAKKQRKRDAVPKPHVHGPECDHAEDHAPLALTSTSPANASMTTVLNATLATPPTDATIVPGGDGLGRAKGFGREFAVSAPVSVAKSV